MIPNAKISPIVFEDERGWLREICRESTYGLKTRQTTLTLSRYGVLRGLHYQAEPYAIGRVVTCLLGTVYDVQLDLKTGEWKGAWLHEYEQIYVPSNFAHGFQVTSETALILYNTTEEFSAKNFRAEYERGILWNDPTLRIDWPLPQNPILSKKDKRWPLWKRQ